MNINLLLNRLQSIQVSKLDDYVDRLNYLWTTMVIVFFCLVVGMQQTFNEPLVCIPQANFPAPWIKYVNNLCYIGGTYHSKMSADLDHRLPQFTVNYYQWIPYTLSLQALSFVIPHFVYLALAGFALSGFNFKQVVDRCHDASNKTTEEMDKQIQDVAWSVYEFTCLPDRKSNLKSLGKILAASYLIGKILNVMVILANLYFLNSFVGVGEISWAFTIVKSALAGQNWETTGYFPRTTFCDVDLNMLGQTQRRTVQCLLMLNILTEKIYVVLYFWLLVLGAITIINLLWVVYDLFIKQNPEVLSFSKPHFEKDELKLGDFLNNYMSLNGLLLIRFVNEHAGSRVAAKFIKHLVQFWKYKPAEKSDDATKNESNTLQKIFNTNLQQLPILHGSLRQRINNSLNNKQDQVSLLMQTA
ncbi:Innexin [Aphelenchoides bicaudatus]|nr:Innexin [Aphelenchoides bicaudatus]